MPDSPETLCGWINPKVLGGVLQDTAVFVLIRFPQLLRAGRSVWLSCGCPGMLFPESGIIALGTGSVNASEGQRVLAVWFGSYRSQWESLVCDHA